MYGRRVMGLGEVARPPHRLQELTLANELAGVTRQHLQQLPFGRRQVQGLGGADGVFLICVGDPRKGGILDRFSVGWPRSGPCWGRWTAVGVEGERPQRSEDERPRGRRGSAVYSVGRNKA